MTNSERIRRLRDAFRNCFRRGHWKREDGAPTEDALRVLRRLRVFCRADVSTFDADPRIHALIEGRREVWIEIVNTLELSDAVLERLREPEEEG